MRSQSELDRQLRTANRVPSGFVGNDASRGLLDEIGAQIVATPRAHGVAGRRRFSLPVARRGVVLGSVAGVLAVGVAAAATTILSTTTVGAGQPGYCQTAINATADVPFPSGDQTAPNWALLLSAVPKQGASLEQLCAGDNIASGNRNPVTGAPATVIVGVINVKATFVMVAFCAWTDQWLAAQQSGDSAAASSAASEIAEARQWPSAQTVDAQSETLDWLPAAQQEVQAGDVNEVAAMFKYSPTAALPASECTAYTPSAGSENGTVNPE